MLSKSKSLIRAKLRKPRKQLASVGRYLGALGRQKIFCIGQNKTGTTSLALAMEELGILVAPTLHDQDMLMQPIIREWAASDYHRILKFCRSAQAFQDYPFSLPNTYKALNEAFPDSKFILTVRDSAEQWSDSFISYYLNKYWGGRHPFAEPHIGVAHPYADFALERMRLIYGFWDDPFDKQKLMQSYETHNRSVQEYFRDQPDDLLVINVAQKDDYRRLCDFLGKQSVRDAFPWLNKTGT